MRYIRLFVTLLLFIRFGTTQVIGQSSSSIFQRLQRLKEHTTVLYIAAHPDDENTQLITWLSQEKNFRTVYLSLTRGDGGQNLIGSELGVDLGLIRTRELMAARAIDGGEQFFSTAFDFGFSKRPEETLTIWEKEQVLEDIVRIIRTVKPDIIICRFPPDQRAGHGHHSSSAILAKEAFIAAADPMRFPGIPIPLSSWKTKAIYWNAFVQGNENELPANTRKIDIGAFNPLIGKGYGEIAAESRSQHKSQGFGVAAERGHDLEYFIPIAGDTGQADLFDVPQPDYQKGNAGLAVQTALQSIISNYNFRQPEKSLSSLLELQTLFNAWPAPTDIKSRKLKELNQIIADCMGLWISITAANESYSVQDTIHASLRTIIRNADGFSIAVSDSGLIDGDTLIRLQIGELITLPLVLHPINKITQPYWLAQSRSGGMFNIRDKELIGSPWNKPATEIFVTVFNDNHRFILHVPVQFNTTDPVKGELYRPLVITPEVTATLNQTLSVFNSTKPRSYTLKLQWNAQQGGSMLLKVKNKLSGQWNAGLKDTLLHFTGNNALQVIPFTVNPTTLSAVENQLEFSYEIVNSNDPLPLLSVKEINYPHIPKITWFPSVSLVLRAADIKINASKILYLKGAGDEVPAMLRQLGISVDEIRGQDLETTNLQTYDAVIAGIRAYNTDASLPLYHDKLMSYIRAGGIYLVQYNTNNNLPPVKYMAPAPFVVSRNRVTDENAEVSITEPEYPVLKSPNNIQQADFTNWIQERGTYFAINPDSSYHDLLKMHDAGEADQGGSLIIAEVGKGRYVYTGLSFFRQLPAGNTGAFRLFTNLISKP